ncbi:phage tail tube protein [Sphaerisporangium sp. NPDC004334]
MSLRSLLAKDWTVEVNTGTPEAKVWTPIRGLTEFTEEIKTKTEDDSDFDNDGWSSDVAVQRGWTLKCKGNRKRVRENPTFTPDPGQEFVRQAGRVVGLEASIEVRWYRKDGSPDANEGFATVDYKGGGGKVTDLEPFELELIGQGKPEPIDNPVAA